MSTVVVEIYDALKKIPGFDDATARAAAAAVAPKADLVTKADLAAALADLRSELIKWNVGTIIAVTAIVVAVVRLTE